MLKLFMVPIKMTSYWPTIRQINVYWPAIGNIVCVLAYKGLHYYYLDNCERQERINGSPIEF